MNGLHVDLRPHPFLIRQKSVNRLVRSGNPPGGLWTKIEKLGSVKPRPYSR